MRGMLCPLNRRQCQSQSEVKKGSSAVLWSSFTKEMLRSSDKTVCMSASRLQPTWFTNLEYLSSFLFLSQQNTEHSSRLFLLNGHWLARSYSHQLTDNNSDERFSKWICRNSDLKSKIWQGSSWLCFVKIISMLVERWTIFCIFNIYLVSISTESIQKPSLHYWWMKLICSLMWCSLSAISFSSFLPRIS